MGGAGSKLLSELIYCRTGLNSADSAKMRPFSSLFSARPHPDSLDARAPVRREPKRKLAFVGADGTVLYREMQIVPEAHTTTLPAHYTRTTSKGRERRVAR